MNANMISNTMYDYLPAATELNKVPGFDPKKFLRKKISEATQEEGWDLDLKYKKLWFRLVHPNGRIKVTALKITEQIAIIEAKIFFDKNDSEPVSSFIAQRYAKEKQGSLYIERAQYAAQDQALTDAGFGVQFSPVSQKPDSELPRKETPTDNTAAEAISDPQRPSAPTDISGQVIPRTTSAVNSHPVMENTPSSDLSETTYPKENSEQREAIEPDNPAQTEEQAEAEMELSIDALTQLMEDTPAQSLAVDVPDAAENAESDEVQTIITASEPPRYTADMPVDEICALMTLEEAEAVVVDVGTCNGWSLSEVAERRPASLKWYLNGYPGENNILRAGAKLLLANAQQQKAG